MVLLPAPRLHIREITVQDPVIHFSGQEAAQQVKGKSIRRSRNPEGRSFAGGCFSK
jgi:hypothetical protein